MFLSNLEGSVVDFHDYLQRLLEEIKGFLYIGEVPIGSRVEHLVWIAEIDQNNKAVLPVEVYELPELWSNTRGEVKLKNGTDFVVESDGRTVTFLSGTDSFPKVGDFYLIYIPYLRATGDNLWRTYGKRLVDLYRKDSEHYRSVLTALLEYFVLGPTQKGTESLFEKPTGVDIRVDDYITRPGWWIGKVLPDWMVDSIEGLPVVGDDLIVGEFFIPDDSDVMLQLRRFCFPSELIDFGQYPILFGGPEYNGKYYFYGGRSMGCLYMDDVGKYHIFLVEGDWEAFSILTSDFELWRAFYKGLFEGKLTSSYPLIYANKTLQDTIQIDFGGETFEISINIFLFDDFTDGFSYGDQGLVFGIESYYRAIFQEFTHPFQNYTSLLYYFGSNSGTSYDGSVVYGFNDQWVQLYFDPSVDTVRILFFNDPGITYGNGDASYGALAPAQITVRPPIKFGEENIAIDYADIYRFLMSSDVYLFAVNDAYDIKKVFVTSDITGFVPVQLDFFVQIEILPEDLLRGLSDRAPLLTFYFKLVELERTLDLSGQYLEFKFIYAEKYNLSRTQEVSEIIRVLIYKDAYNIADSIETFAYIMQDRSMDLLEGTSRAFKDLLGFEPINETSTLLIF